MDKSEMENAHSAESICLLTGRDMFITGHSPYNGAKVHQNKQYMKFLYRIMCSSCTAMRWSPYLFEVRSNQDLKIRRRKRIFPLFVVISDAAGEP